MKRFVVKLAIFLLLSAIINVTVAWVLAVRHPRGFDSRPVTQGDTLHWAAWPRGESVEWGGAPTRIWTHHSAGATVLIAVQEDEDGFPKGRSFSVQTGWPLRSMKGQLWFAETDEGPVKIYRNALEGDRFGVSYPEYPKILPIPLMPLFPGLAINTTFYAAILWALFAVPFAMRRRRRMKRGLCARCAYPVGVSDTCTECGKRVR